MGSQEHFDGGYVGLSCWKEFQGERWDGNEEYDQVLFHSEVFSERIPRFTCEGTEGQKDRTNRERCQAWARVCAKAWETQSSGRRSPAGGRVCTLFSTFIPRSSYTPCACLPNSVKTPPTVPRRAGYRGLQREGWDTQITPWSQKFSRPNCLWQVKSYT